MNAVPHIKNSVPPVAYLRDLEGQELEWAWYESELQRVVKASKEKWTVERVLQKERSNGILDYLLYWFSYDKSHDSWIKVSDVARLPHI